ncbi:MAG TPA: hypothetical protein VMG12_31420 [Polyangiaceae bacterium]|nr:hypothetical protein [Polyangiaceae bacterium]
MSGPAAALLLFAASLLACDARKEIPPVGTAPKALETRDEPDPFVRVRGTRFVRGGQPLGAIMGCNYWSAATDSRTGAGRARVTRELDRLKALGVGVLRVLALSEGPDSEPWRITPSLQPSPGAFDSDGLAALDWLMVELARRDLSAVFTLNNYWFWSGGTAQYVSWARGVPIPYPGLEGGGAEWDRFGDFSAEFFIEPRARALFDAALDTIIPRYASSPAVFAWELVNEPQPRRHAVAFRSWADATARRIHRLDPNHLVTTGSEGNTPAPALNGLDIDLDHASPAIDFVSVHAWPENWGWTRAEGVQKPVAEVAARVRAYLDEQLRDAAPLGKPVLLLETGYPRDSDGFAPGTPVTARDRYLELIFEATLESRAAGSALTGAFPWAWSGEATPEQPGVVAASNPLTGDPPHERQGWYGIYASDSSTTDVIARSATRFREASR